MLHLGSRHLHPAPTVSQQPYHWVQLVTRQDADSWPQISNSQRPGLRAGPLPSFLTVSQTRCSPRRPQSTWAIGESAPTHAGCSPVFPREKPLQRICGLGGKTSSGGAVSVPLQARTGHLGCVHSPIHPRPFALPDRWHRGGTGSHHDLGREQENMSLATTSSHLRTREWDRPPACLPPQRIWLT